MANDFLPFGTSGTANVYTNAEYVADTDHTNGNQPGIAKSKLVNKALRQCSIISAVVAQFISDITGTNSVDDGTTATLLANLKLATKGRIGAPIASATTTTVGGDAAGDVIHITGTTTITSLGTSITGTKRVLIFDGALTLTHNIASLILPGAANIITIAGAVGVFVCEDGALGYWKCIGYTDDITNKAALKTYFDTLYSPVGSVGSKIQPITASVATNALTVTLNPTTLDFRSATVGDGTVTALSNASPISLVVPSSATLGTTNGIPARLVLLDINNAGTMELAIVNLAGGNDLSETGVITTTAISAGATASNIIYSTTGRTSVAYRVVGFIDITEATAGTWATAPSTIQGIGGQALASMSSLGYGQTEQNVTGSRALATTYTNSTGKPIEVKIYFIGGNNLSSNLAVNGISVGAISNATGGTMGATITAIVPSGGTYIATGNLPISNWAELR